jgi:hypothetical protein
MKGTAVTAEPRTEQWPFLSIVSWPQGDDREDIARLLARPGGPDLPTLRLRMGQAPPMVLEQVDPDVARAMIDALVAAGGDGFTFTLEDLQDLGPALGIRDLRVAEGALAIDLREGLSTMLPCPHVQVLVRAQLSRTVTRRREPPQFTSTSIRRRTWDSIKAEVEAATTKHVETSDKLDIHAVDGTVYEIDGDRFRYEALGDLRGHSDKANMDSMCELLSHLCPDAVVDTYFKIWRPPPGHRRIRIPGMDARRQDSAFVFYSRWAALTYRHVMGP